MAEIPTYRYSDISLHPEYVSSSIVLDEKSINQNIILILMTPVRAAWFDPAIGSAIIPLLFEPIDDVTAFRLQQEILKVLERNGELRIVITGVRVLANPDAQDFYVTLGYEIPGLDGRKIEFNFNLSA